MNDHTTPNAAASQWLGLERFDPVAMSLAGAAVGALCLVVATAMLIIQGPAPGQPLGGHLGVLGDYLPGYSVNWPGAGIGALYGAAAGALMGFVVAVFWNITHLVLIRLLLLQRLMTRI